MLWRPRAASAERERQLAAVRQRAVATGRPVLLRWCESSDVRSPWDFVALAGGAGEPFFVSRDGESGVTLAAVGSIEELSTDAATRLGDAAGLCARLLERDFDVALDGRPPVWPLVCGGFSFAPRPLGGPWRGWPSAWFFVPRALWVTAKDQAWAAVHLEVGPDVTYEQLAERMLEGGGGKPRPVQVAATVTEEDAAGFAARTRAALAHFGPSLEKVVLARVQRHQAPPGERFDAEATFAAAVQRDPEAFVYALGSLGGDAFVGATPERLVEVEGRRVRTTALAGTTARGRSPERDRALVAALCDSPKERQEHLSVVSALRAELSAHSYEVMVAPTGVRATPDVYHLETRIDALQRQPGGLFGWAERLHPTPAVAGHPRRAALEYLASGEALERGYYSGAVGYASAAGDGALWVAIRSALLRGREAFLYAGAGIVPGSRPEAEWQETEHKLLGMQSALRTVAEGP